MTLRKITLIATALLTSIALSACHSENNDNVASQATSQNSLHTSDEHNKNNDNVASQATSQNSLHTSDKQNKNNDNKNETGSPKESSSETISNNQPNNTSATSNQVQTSIDLKALSQGDYSSIVGKWSNADGNSFIIDAQGNITNVYEETTIEGYHIQLNQVSETIFLGGLIAPNGQAEGSFMIIPAGSSTPNAGKIYEQDVICSGQSVLAEENPYYKTN